MWILGITAQGGTGDHAMRNYRFLCFWGVENARFHNAAQAQAFADRIGARSFYAI